jgi:hypothetical protein
MFKAGQNIWPVGNTGKKTIPFPLEWLVVRLDNLDTEKWQKIGFAFEGGWCIDTGKEFAAGEGLRCVRCGITLHESAANVVTSQDPPKCRRCLPLIALAV